MGSILDLPLERQKEIAEDSNMSFEEWKAFMKEIIDDDLSDIETVHLTGKEAEEYLKEHGDFYARCFT